MKLSSLRYLVSNLLIFFLILVFSVQIIMATSSYYSTGDNGLSADVEDYTDILAKLILDNRQHKKSIHRRSCLRRGVSCDGRPNDCCYSSACRCNLWGVNCRCQRMGLFQRWGR